MKKYLGIVRAELIFSHTPGNKTGAAIVPAESLPAINEARDRYGCETDWWFAVDPETGVKREAYTPIEAGRLDLIRNAGIRHGERFVARIGFWKRKYDGVDRVVNGIID
jgi:hypothetical protein